MEATSISSSRPDSVPLRDPVAESRRLVEAANRLGVVARVLGGAAVYLQAPAEGPLLPRPIKDIDVVSTGSLGLDLALGVGGLPRGRVVEIYGPESSGKTTLTLQVIAEMQKIGGTAAFIDAGPAASSFTTKPMPASWMSSSAASRCATRSRSPIASSASR